MSHLYTSPGIKRAVTFMQYVPLGAEPAHRLSVEVLRDDQLLKAIE